MDPNQNGSDGSLRDLWLGIAASIGAYILTIFMGPVVFVTFIVHIIAIIVSFNKGRKRLGQGLLIGFGLVILLTAACFGILITGLGG